MLIQPEWIIKCLKCVKNDQEGHLRFCPCFISPWSSGEPSSPRRQLLCCAQLWKDSAGRGFSKPNSDETNKKPCLNKSFQKLYFYNENSLFYFYWDFPGTYQAIYSKEKLHLKLSPQGYVRNICTEKQLYLIFVGLRAVHQLLPLYCAVLSVVQDNKKWYSDCRKTTWSVWLVIPPCKF